MDLAEARAIALRTASAAMKRPVVILDDRTLERDFGWVFFYQSQEYVSDGIAGARLFGNAPVIVNRHTGRPTFTGTALPIEDYLAAYESLGAERFDAGEWREFLKTKINPLE